MLIDHLITECPECRTELDFSLKACGSLCDMRCKRCGFFGRVNTGSMNFSDVHDWALREAQFRRLVRKAMIKGGLIDLDQQTDFLLWMIGEDYKFLPYAVFNIATASRETDPDCWLARMRDRARLRGINMNTKVYPALCAAVENYKSTRVFMGLS